MNVIKSSTPMRRKNDDTSSLETECLFGEMVEVLNQHSNWVNCKLKTDDYIGWVKKNDLGKIIKSTHLVFTIRTYIYKEPSPKSNIVTPLSMGSQLCVGKIEKEWAKVYYLDNNIIKTGYVPANHIMKLKQNVSNWVGAAQSLEGTPYKWGGRDTLGLDCSALLQLSYRVYGQLIPRNTSDQVKLKKPIVSKIDELNRGCVIFWKGHVGIMVDRLNCIHANAYHMKTITEPLVDIISRMHENDQIVKMMNFN